MDRSDYKRPLAKALKPENSILCGQHREMLLLKSVGPVAHTTQVIWPECQTTSLLASLEPSLAASLYKTLSVHRQTDILIDHEQRLSADLLYTYI